MTQYSIADLEKLSGIKAHTIRIWEQRYGLLKPNRTQTNIRYYDDTELKKLLNVTTLLKNGMKISDISRLSENELKAHITKITLEQENPQTQYDIHINQLIAAALKYDEHNFERCFASCILRYGIHNTYMHIVYPLLNKLGLMWGVDEVNPCQEHFASNLLKQKFFTAIDALPVSPDAGKSFLLFLPEGEDHELGLLFSHYYIRQHHCKTIYLGQNVPVTSLRQSVAACKPDYLLTFIVRNFPAKELREYIEMLSSLFPKTKILISGNSSILEQIQPPGNVIWVRSPEELRRFL